MSNSEYTDMYRRLLSVAGLLNSVESDSHYVVVESGIKVYSHKTRWPVMGVLFEGGLWTVVGYQE